MKFLEDDKLAQLTSELTEAVLSGTERRVIDGRIEAYTMKRAGTEKKVAHILGERFIKEILEGMEEDKKKMMMKKSGGISSRASSEGSDVYFFPPLPSKKKKKGVARICDDEEEEIIVGVVEDDGEETKYEEEKEVSSSNKRRRRSQSVGSYLDGSTTTKTTTNKPSRNRTRRKSPRQTSHESALTHRVRSSSCDISSHPSSSLLPPKFSLNSTNNNNNIMSNTSNLTSLGNFHEMSTRRLMIDLILTLNASFPDYDFTNIVRPNHFIKVHNAFQRINARLSEFSSSPPSRSVNYGLCQQKLVGGGGPNNRLTFLPRLWSALDDVIQLKGCDVYSYVPPGGDGDDDPLGFLSHTLASGGSYNNSNNIVDDGDYYETYDGDDYDNEDEDILIRRGGAPRGSLWSFNYFFVNKSLKRIVFFSCVQTIRDERSFVPLEEEEEEEDEGKDDIIDVLRVDKYFKGSSVSGSRRDGDFSFGDKSNHHSGKMKNLEYHSGDDDDGVRTPLSMGGGYYSMSECGGDSDVEFLI